MKLLTPEEVLEALRKDKSVEVKLSKRLPWEPFNKFRMNVNVLVNPEVSFRLAQEMVTIGDISFPKPESEPLTENTRYYLPYLLNPNEPYENLWDDVHMDFEYLKLGLIPLSKENAVKHAKALIKLSGGTGREEGVC